jgi:DMSO/TMAO reductase YedYZ molybdopterin-dependent catalytic subunit
MTIPTKRPGLLTGILVGALLGVALIALLFAGEALFTLPNVPLAIMDTLPNILPVDLLNFGKESMISVLTTLNIGRLDTVAKTAEAVIGSSVLFGLFVVGTAALYAGTRNSKDSGIGRRIGLIGGLVLGVILALMYVALPTTQFERSGLGLIVAAVYIIAIVTGFAYAAGYIADRLGMLPAGAASGEVAASASATQLDRRQFLVRVGGTTATLTVAGAVVSLLGNASGTEVIDTTASGDPTPSGAQEGTPAAVITDDSGFVPAPGTRPEVTPLENHYRIDIVSRPPEIDGSSWRLNINGLVGTAAAFTLDELRAMPSQSEILTMSCISNPVGGDLISTIKWTGVPMQHILDLVQPEPGAAYLKITCADGFDEYVDVDKLKDDPRIMLAYAWDDRPLLQKHGFPIRIHIPNLFGMKQPKWITNMEFVRDWEEGYWVRRGWSADAVIQQASVIDTVATTNTYEQDGVTYVPIGGMAFAGDRGIQAVELSIDNGDWIDVTDRKAPISDRTWILWRYDWAYASGAHNFRVRSIDGKGVAQVESVAPARPDGATGLYRIARIV